MSKNDNNDNNKNNSDKVNNTELERLARKAADGLNITGQENSTLAPQVLSSLELIAKIKNAYQKNQQHSKKTNLIEEGDHWGHLTIEKKLGQGAIGFVYEAYDPILERQVAVKILQPQSFQYTSPKGFINEARRLAKVRHPNILAIFGANTYKDITGFWSDLIHGKTLDCVIKAPISWPQILSMADDLIQAVHEVHQNDIIHGDIKPQNVMLDQNNQTVLMDFGSGTDLSKK